MRTGAAGSIIAAVLKGAMHLLLDLDAGGEPVRGQVGLADAVPRSFTGYADLIATLESIRVGESQGHDATTEEVPS